MKGLLQLTGRSVDQKLGSRDFFDHGRHRPLQRTRAKASPRTMLTAEAAQKIIGEKMREKSTKLLNIFRFLDKNNDGCINHEEFREALQHMGINLSDGEFKKLLGKYSGAFRNGVMAFQAFQRQFATSILGGSDVTYQEAIMTQKPVIRRQKDRFMSADEAFRALTQKMIRGGTTVQKFFNRFDSDRDRVISIPEFRAGLGDMGIKMDDKEFHGKFVGLFGNTFNDGVMNKDEFHQTFSKYLRGSGKDCILNGMAGRVVRQPIEGRHLSAEEAKKVFFQKLAYGKSFGETFRKLDQNKDGYVSKVELQQALKGMGIRMSKPEYLRFLSSYPDHFDHNGNLDFNSFQKMFSTAPSNTRVLPLNQQKPAKGMLKHRGATINARAANQVFLRKLAQKGTSVTEAFRRIDTDHNNKISKVEFRTALVRLGIELDDENFTEFMKFYEHVFDETGVMNIRDFKNQFGHILEGHGIGSQKAASGPIIPINTFDDDMGNAPRTRLPNGRKVPTAEPSLVSHMKAHDMLCETVKPSALRKALERVDLDNDGIILLPDFRTALLHLGIKLSDSAFRKLVELYSAFTHAGTFFSGRFAHDFSAFSSVKHTPRTGRKQDFMSHELAYKRAKGHRKQQPKMHALWQSTNRPKRPTSARPSSRGSARSVRSDRPPIRTRTPLSGRRYAFAANVEDEMKAPEQRKSVMVNPKSSREAIRLLLIKVKPSVAENWKYLRQQLIRQAQNKRPPIHTAPRAEFIKVLRQICDVLTVPEAGFLATAFQSSRSSTEVDFNNFVRVVLTTKTRRGRR